jgi:hypothetical protein
MPEAIISTDWVRTTPDGNAVEVSATLDAGQIIPGMFLHIPLNRSLDFTVRIREIVPQGERQIRLILDCNNDPETADMVLAFNFEEETLWVLESGED